MEYGTNGVKTRSIYIITKGNIVEYNTTDWCGGDVAFLNELVNDAGITKDELDDEVLSNMWDKLLLDPDDINTHIRAVFTIMVDRFKCKALKLIYMHPADTKEFPEPNIYTNFMDSGYDSVYNNYDLNNLSDEAVMDFINSELRSWN